MIPVSAHDRDLVAHAARIAPELHLDALDDAAVLRIVREHGPDLATAVIYDRIRRCPRHAALVARVEQGDTARTTARVLVGVVPGAFYDRHHHTGADGERVLSIARGLGFEAERVEVKPFGGTAENGRIVARWLAAKAEMGSHRIALVSLSKGTLDALEAVRVAGPRELASVCGWLSLSGLWAGTGLVEWLDRHPLRRLLIRGLLAFQHLPYSTVESLRRNATGHRIGLPTARIVSVVGVPLQSHLAHRWAPKAYGRLSLFGPSDGGGIVLSDVRHFPGEVYPVWGADHYLNPAWDLSTIISRLLLEVAYSGENSVAAEHRPETACAATANSPPASRSIA